MVALTMLLCLVEVGMAQYTIQSNFSGATFFDNFDFWTSWDPTFGFVQYVDQSTAQSLGMINATEGGPANFGVEHQQVLDPTANLGRLSLRLTTRQSWTHGLFIVDLAHMPATTCGLWPAMWTLGNSTGVWPEYGEIDIVEYVNLVPDNLMALHTAPGCTIAGSGQDGDLLTNDCGKDGGFAGCYTTPKQRNSAGTAFNENGGGVYAMEWSSVAIRIWFFPRDRIPSNINAASPDPSSWPLPDSNFESSNCDIDKYFFNHSLIFNTEFCGSWAGPTFIEDGCPALNSSNQWSSCNMFVAATPEAFVDAYWAVNYIEVYTTAAGSPPPPSSSLSSVVPVASTSSVTGSGAEGRTSTPSESLAPPSASTTPTSSSTMTVASSEATSSSTVQSPTSGTTSSQSTSSSPISLIAVAPSASTPPVGPVIVFITTYVTIPPGTRVLPAVHWPSHGPETAADDDDWSMSAAVHEKRAISSSELRSPSLPTMADVQTTSAKLAACVTSKSSYSPTCCFSYKPLTFVTSTIVENGSLNANARLIDCEE